MLQLVLGRAGTGKSTYLLDKLCEAAQDGQRVILLVPEQFSFESERTVYRRLGGAAMSRVEVLSFTRLSDLVFRQYGGMAGRRLDEPTRLVLMSAALDEVGEELELYQRSLHNSSFLNLMLDVTTQFKNAGVLPEELNETAAGLEDQALSLKLRELSLIYAAFQALVERNYSDPLDDISRAATLAAQQDFFKDRTVFIDGFMSFTAAEHRFLDVILRESPLVTATFCTDDGAMGEEGGIFYSNSHTAMRLVQTAQRHGVTVKKPIRLQKPLRYQSPGLVAVEELLCGETPQVSQSQGVALVRAALPYDEVEYAAAQICRLIRQQELRYRDTVIIARDMDRYASAVETVFARYQIPFFLDRAVDLEAQPVALALLAALEAVRGSYDTDEILRLAKSPVFGLTAQAAAELENYCFVWGVKGNSWTADFENNPQGMDSRMGENERQTLVRLNDTRRTLMTPLAQLKERLRGCTGAQFARATYDYLCEIGCVEHIRAFCAQLPGEEKKRELELTEAIWDQLMDLLDVFATALETARYPLGKFIDLLRMTITSVEVGQIPRTLDQVMVGSADRIRPHQPAAVFVLGVNEGIFPPAVKEGGVFSDRERISLAQVGIELGQPVLRRTLEERFFLYRALCSPSHYLCASYACAEPQGRALIPSFMLEKLLSGLPDAKIDAVDLPLADRVMNAATAEEEFARRYAQPDSHSGSLVDFLRQTGQSDAIARLDRARNFGVSGDITPHSANRLFGRDMTLSATRLEEFYRCPFQYYCKYGLGVRPLKKAEFSPLESGTVIHYVLEQMVARHGGKALLEIDELELHREITELIQGYLADIVAQQDVLPARTKYLFGRLVSILVRILQRLGAEFAQSLFFPAGIEVKVGYGAEVEPIHIVTQQGVGVTVQGSIDRVDLLRQDGKQYARVVDYKSGGKKFRLSDIYYGLNMQMLVYLFALCEGGQGQYADSQPAGILYMPAKAEAVELPRRSNEEEVGQKHSAAFKMNGLLLNDEQILTAMEEALAGEYIPAKRTSSGYDRYSSLANPKELEKIKGHVKQVIGEMGDRLVNGQVAPCPAVTSGYSPCEYCDYTALCHRDRLENVAECASFSDADFYALLEEQEKGGAAT